MHGGSVCGRELRIKKNEPNLNPNPNPYTSVVFQIKSCAFAILFRVFMALSFLRLIYGLFKMRRNASEYISKKVLCFLYFLKAFVEQFLLKQNFLRLFSLLAFVLATCYYLSSDKKYFLSEKIINKILFSIITMVLAFEWMFEF